MRPASAHFAPRADVHARSSQGWGGVVPRAVSTGCPGTRGSSATSASAAGWRRSSRNDLEAVVTAEPDAGPLPAALAVEDAGQPRRVLVGRVLQREAARQQRCHLQADQLPGADGEPRGVEQPKLAAETGIPADALVVVDQVTAAVEHEPAPVDLD